MKKLLYTAAVAAVALTAATPRAGSTQTVDNPPPRETGERDLYTNPFTGHIYCLVLGSGCIVHG